MRRMCIDDATRTRIELMIPTLNERELRRYLAIEIKTLGYGGISVISELTGVSRVTLTKGNEELENELTTGQRNARIRNKGGGRKSIKITQPQIVNKLKELVENDTYGSPESKTKYKAKSLRTLASALNEDGIKVTRGTVGMLLEELDYSLQTNSKCEQVGEDHPDRDKQFKFIYQKCDDFMNKLQPVISVDTKKKEIIGNFGNKGRVYCKKGKAVKVRDHDYGALAKVAPYGVYDLNDNTGFVNLGISKDTSDFAVESIRRWWNKVGKEKYPKAEKLYIMCDGGGSNSSSGRRWKTELQKLAHEINIDIHVSHFPPGTSKWNKIEHRLFCYISSNWRGKPLMTVETTIELIKATSTAEGLTVDCVLDNNIYRANKELSQEELKALEEDFSELNIKHYKFHGEWNYYLKK